MKDTIFISHATPADNTFAAWLATKLELAGYKTWVDLNNLLPSVDFWNHISSTIRESAVKFIFIASNISISTARDGIRKELSIADKVRKTSDENFIIPLRIDNLNYDADMPVEVVRLNFINFYPDWSNGLKILLEYLIKEEVPRLSEKKSSEFYIHQWFQRSQSEHVHVMDKEEIYTSNIFNISFPREIFIYKTSDNLVGELSSRRIAFKRCHSVLITFACNHCVFEWVGDIEHIRIDTESALKIVDRQNFLGECIYNLARDVISILNFSIGELFFSRGLVRFKSDRRTNNNVYYFPMGSKVRSEITKRSKALAGIYHKDKHWHFAVSGFICNDPFKGLLIRWHLVFSNKDGELLSDSSQIPARRSKGRLYFNKQWGELLLAASNFLTKSEKDISFAVCCQNNTICIDPKPNLLVSCKGYIEPKANLEVEDY